MKYPKSDWRLPTLVISVRCLTSKYVNLDRPAEQVGNIQVLSRMYQQSGTLSSLYTQRGASSRNAALTPLVHTGETCQRTAMASTRLSAMASVIAMALYDLNEP
eukprot:6193976-Pleurochrysis_carterae.AAC.2